MSGAQVRGKLQTDLLQNGTVQMIFFPGTGGGNGSPLLAKNLDVAERDFIRTFNLTRPGAAALRSELEGHGTASADTSIDVELAAKLCVPRNSMGT